MIDVNWFCRVLSFARPNIAGRDHERLCKELGEIYEVLPFIVMAGGFNDWPLTRTALKAVAKGVTRPSQMRPASAASLRPDIGRAHMREQMGRMLDAHGVHLPSESEVPLPEQVTALVRASRASSYSKGNDPSLYISAE